MKYSEVLDMVRKMKKTDLRDVEAVERMKLTWQISRQIQQKMLERKLIQCVLKPRKGLECLQRYPEGMQPMIRDFLRKAAESIDK